MPNEEYIYQSEHTGPTIDEAIGTTVSKETYWDNKVDRVAGKGLSTNDFTNTDKTNLNRVGTLLNGITSVTTTIQNNNTTVPTGKAVLDAVSDLGGGDMLRASYDTTNTGTKVDTAINAENADQLGGIVRAIRFNGAGAEDPETGNPLNAYITFLKVKKHTSATGSSNCAFLISGTVKFSQNLISDTWLLCVYNYDNSFAVHVTKLSGPGATSTHLPEFGYYEAVEDGVTYYYVGVKRDTWGLATTVMQLQLQGGDASITPNFDNYGYSTETPTGWTSVSPVKVSLTYGYVDGIRTLNELTSQLDSWLSGVGYYSTTFYGVKNESSYSVFDGNNNIYYIQLCKAGSNDNAVAIFYRNRSGSGGAVMILMSKVGGVWQTPIKALDGEYSQVSHRSELLIGEDTRSTQAAPSSYYTGAESGGSRKVEFKSASAVGLPTSGIDKSRVNYWSVETNTAWSNATGSRPVQIASSEKQENSVGIPLLKARTATDDSTWGSWKTIALRERDLNRSTLVTDSDTNLSTVMARGIYAGTTDMVAGSTALPAGVIYLVIEE